MLRAMFNLFRKLGNESVQETFDRLSDIANGLQSLDTEYITDPEVVKKMFQSLDSSFDSLVLMIKERSDYKSLNPINVMEKLKPHKRKEEENRDPHDSNSIRTLHPKLEKNIYRKIKNLLMKNSSTLNASPESSLYLQNASITSKLNVLVKLKVYIK